MHYISAMYAHIKVFYLASRVKYLLICHKCTFLFKAYLALKCKVHIYGCPYPLWTKHHITEL